MSAISLKLPEDLLAASGRYADALRLTRAAYPSGAHSNR